MNAAWSKSLRTAMIAMAVAAMIVARSAKAAAVTVTNNSLTVTAADPVGNAITDASLMASRIPSAPSGR